MEVFKNRRGKLDQECQRYGLSKERGASSPAVRKAVIQLCGFFCSRSHGEQGAAFGLQLLQCHTWDAAAASVQRPLGLTWPRTLSVTGDPTFALQLLGAAEISPQFPKLRQEELTWAALTCQTNGEIHPKIFHSAAPAPKMPSSASSVLKTGALVLSCSGPISSTVPYMCLIQVFSKFCVFRNCSACPSGPPKCCLKK